VRAVDGRERCEADDAGCRKKRCVETSGATLEPL
jgi:hypothetical protein